MRLFEEMRKNVLSLFRSPAALVTLVLGPLTLLILVGIALSGNTPHGIRVGITGADSVGLNATIDSFDTLAQCIDALRTQHIHLCLEFRDFMNERGISQRTVVFHVDESRNRLSSLVLQQVSRQLGIESSKIRVEAVQGLLNEFGRIAAFMADKRGDLVQLRQDALTLHSDVVQRRVRLEAQQRTFRVAYYPVRASLSNSSVTFTDVQVELSRLVDDFSDAVTVIASTSNDTNTTLLEERVANLSAAINQTREQTNQTQTASLSLIQALDGIDAQLEADIQTSKEYEAKIDAGVRKIDTLLLQLDKDIEELSKLDPSIAQRIDNPIIQEVRTLFEKLLPIQAGFAQLFGIVIMFISTLFGTIVTLMEINSRAVLRNTLTPTGEGWTVVALGLTSFVVVAIQAAVLLIVAQNMLDVNVLSALHTFMLIGGMLALTFILIGMSIALLLHKEQASILVATFTALVVLLFSDVLTSVELMPETVGTFVRQSPLVVSTFLLTQDQLFGFSPTLARTWPLIIAAAISVVLLLVAFQRYKARAARW